MGCRKLKIQNYFTWSDHTLPCRVRTPSKVYVEPVFSSLENPKNTEFSFNYSPEHSFFVPEEFYYAKKAYSGFFKVPIDANGNTLSNGTENYTWNEENRLISLAPITPAVDDKKCEFIYDGNGRRRVKKVYTWNGSAWDQTKELRFVWNDWNLVATLDATDAVTKSYLWGEDGLLSETNSSGTYLATRDGNKNIMGYLDASTGSVVADYEYSPFGKLIVKSDTMADDFNFKFSSYYTDSETGLVYYGYRYYDADMGRWINRDPIEERGGNNLYGFCNNNAISNWDLLGNMFDGGVGPSELDKKLARWKLAEKILKFYREKEKNQPISFKETGYGKLLNKATQFIMASKLSVRESTNGTDRYAFGTLMYSNVTSGIHEILHGYIDKNLSLSARRDEGVAYAYDFSNDVIMSQLSIFESKVKDGNFIGGAMNNTSQGFKISWDKTMEIIAEQFKLKTGEVGFSSKEFHIDKTDMTNLYKYFDFNFSCKKLVKIYKEEIKKKYKIDACLDCNKLKGSCFEEE